MLLLSRFSGFFFMMETLLEKKLSKVRAQNSVSVSPLKVGPGCTFRYGSAYLRATLVSNIY
jgi:hypothetical protein